MVEKAVKTIVASLRNPVNVDLGKGRELTRFLMFEYQADDGPGLSTSTRQKLVPAPR